jgi:hypothetical protein
MTDKKPKTPKERLSIKRKPLKKPGAALNTDWYSLAHARFSIIARKEKNGTGSTPSNAGED